MKLPRFVSRLLGKKPTGLRSQYFGGARTGRLHDDFMPALVSADGEIKADLYMLRARSRMLYRDNANIAGFVGELKMNVVGTDPDGIRLQARVKSKSGELLSDDNKELEDKFSEWGEPETCSADGQNGWGDFQRLAIATWWIDGECFIQRLPGYNNQFGYALKMIDADLLDSNLNTDEQGTRIVMGVEINPDGRPLAYHFFNRHPTERGFNRTQRTRVPADQIIHLFTQLRPNQRRGIPAVTPVMLAMKMLDGYTEAEITAARTAACAGVWFTYTGEDAQAYAPPSTDPAKDDVDPTAYTANLEPALGQVAPPGANVVAVDPTHPNGNFADFQKAILRMIARGIGAAYSTLSGNIEDVNYSSIRAGLLSERDMYRMVQRWMTVKVHRLVYRDFLRMAALTGQIDLEYPTDIKKSAACAWQFRGWPWVDPQAEFQTNSGEVAMGVNSRQRIAAERGRDFEEMLMEQAEEQKLAKKYGIILGQDAMVESTKVTVDDPSKQTNGGAPRNGNGNGADKTEKNRVALHLEPL